MNPQPFVISADPVNAEFSSLGQGLARQRVLPRESVRCSLGYRLRGGEYWVCWHQNGPGVRPGSTDTRELP
jgi:hypothetical protein